MLTQDTRRPVSLSLRQGGARLVALGIDSSDAEMLAAEIANCLGLPVRGTTVEKQAAEAADMPQVLGALRSVVYRRCGELRIRLGSARASYPRRQAPALGLLFIPGWVSLWYFFGDWVTLVLLLLFFYHFGLDLAVNSTPDRPDIVVSPGALEVTRWSFLRRPSTMTFLADDEPEINVKAFTGMRSCEKVLSVSTTDRKVLLGHGLPDAELAWLAKAIQRVLESPEPLLEVKQKVVDARDLVVDPALEGLELARA